MFFTFVVTKRGNSTFYDTRLIHRISASERGRQKEKNLSLSLSSAVGNRRSGVSASGELDFPRVSVGIRPFVRSFVRSFVRLADWLAGWLAEFAAAASKHVSPGGQ